ncbi:MAG: hypothetical protein IRZ05_03475, partial [Micromonosporaceae bacterium]|nr:hypothetical protein [Micromonosporaceae bacterium]
MKSQIRAHAGRVEEVGNRVDTARSAASQVSMTAEAYGRLCSPLLVPILSTLEGVGIAGIGASAAAVDGTALALRTMANNLELVEGFGAPPLGGAGGGGGG